MNPPSERLPFWTKLLYGTGDWGISTFNTLRLIFYAIFLTDVVGLDPRLASVATLIGILWDAVNDPLIGSLSDRINGGRFGKKRFFLVWFSLPFGLAYLVLWWAPPIENQLVLTLFIAAAFMLADTFQSLVSVPYYSLTATITNNYDQRTSLTTFRMFFNLASSLVVAIVAPEIIKAVAATGAPRQQGYMLVAAIFGGIAVVPLLLIGFFIREQEVARKVPAGPSLWQVLRGAWKNIPFRFATLIYMLNWMTFDLIALMLPFFLTYWVTRGDLLARANLFGVNLAIESAVLGVLLITAVVTLPFWNWLSARLSKRTAYLICLVYWCVVLLAILTIQPGQVNTTLVIAFLAGIGASAAHVLPDAIFPDVIEWNELRTGSRFDGVFYGTKNFMRKLTGAFATFIALQMLGWFGYTAPAPGAVTATQPASALMAIRILTGPTGAFLLLSAIPLTWYYPLTRDRHARIRRLLLRRRALRQSLHS